MPLGGIFFALGYGKSPKEKIMALLPYQNLGVPRPDAVMKAAFFGLRTFYEYLSKTIAYMESDAAVLRLAWKRSRPPESFPKNEMDVWIELIEPADRPNEPEQTFRAFLDENNEQVYEAAPAQPQDGENQRPRRYNFNDPNQRIEIFDRDPKTNRLLLERLPSLPYLLLRPNTYAFFCQLRSVRNLQDAPAPAHLPLLRLLQQNNPNLWGAVYSDNAEVKEWLILTDPGRPGTDAQRRFVQIALTTPDFAFLEGPPGSGKTTAICELILQAIRRGQRVLLCASTHVAVDNVLERLVDVRETASSELIPVRIGDRRNISDAAKPYQFEEFVKTERQRLLKFLQKQNPRTEAQESFLKSMSHIGTPVEKMILDAANLVCGTTIGILQHPDIKAALKNNKRSLPQFDLMVLDEASKTTFQEFLVPGLLAERWIIVGDPQQLSPYVEEEALAVNLAACLPNPATRNVCVDVFLASKQGPHHRSALVVTTEEALLADYTIQGQALDLVVSAEAGEGLALADIVVLPPELIAANINQLPLDIATIRGAPAMEVAHRRGAAWRHKVKQNQDPEPLWENEVSWRLARHYEQRLAAGETATKLWDEIQGLLPVDGVGDGPASVWQRIDRVRRVALPSVLESLQYGFKDNVQQHVATALSDGLPPITFQERHVLLEYQHRMHPEISEFSRIHVYKGQALKDPPDMAKRREWSFGRYQHRAFWLDVRGRFEPHFNRNQEEADVILEELRHFYEWACNEPAPGQRPWEVAVLAFYRGQERELRHRLRTFSGQSNAFYRFRLGKGNKPDVLVELCTVDRFQGHEADMVFLSIANTHSTNFLESPNRLNVAITRPRYQRVIVGHRQAMQKSRGPILQALAQHEPWALALGGER